MRLAVVSLAGEQRAQQIALQLAAIDLQATAVGPREDDLPDGTAMVLIDGGSPDAAGQGGGNDEPSSSVLAALAPTLGRAIAAHAGAGHAVLGVGSGFAYLCAVHLLPGRVTDQGARAFSGGEIFVRVEGQPTPFTGAIPAARVLRVRCGAHNVRYVASDLPDLEAMGRVVLRHVDESAAALPAANPNGSHANIAAVSNAGGNVVGTLIEVQDSLEPGSGDGRQFFEALRLWHRSRGTR